MGQEVRGLVWSLENTVEAICITVSNLDGY